VNDPKAMLRAELRRAYADLDEVYKNNVDAAIVSRVLDFECYKNSDQVFLYASTGNEINTLPLIHSTFKEGKRVFLPKCYSKGVMEFYIYDNNLTVGKYGISEPTGTLSAAPMPKDLMIVPGLSFTPNGWRLGQGGGFYDRYMEKHPCITVGLCRECFLAKELPIAWNDLPVDFVITETAVYERKNGAS
jgi:5-formyltetrahydrofolate cyclo-ligase